MVLGHIRILLKIASDDKMLLTKVVACVLWVKRIFLGIIPMDFLPQIELKKSIFHDEIPKLLSQYYFFIG